MIVVFGLALGRFLAPFFHGLIPALHPTYLIINGVCVALILYDYVVYKHSWAPYWIALGGIAFGELTMFAAPKIPAFMALMHGMGLPS